MTVAAVRYAKGVFDRDLRVALRAPLAPYSEGNLTKILVVVVVYGIQLRMSETLERLHLLSERSSRIISILVWNNGPVPISPNDELPSNWILVNAIENTPLGIIYNEVISHHDIFDLFVIFDQDTRFDHAFFDIVEESEPMARQTLAIPTSVSGGLIVSPILRDYKTKTKLRPGLFDGRRYTAVGSGMVIPRSVAREFCFTTELQFYGVDHDFFKRVAKRYPIMLLPSTQEHSISTRGTLLMESDFKMRSLVHSIFFNKRDEVGSFKAFTMAAKVVLRESIRARSIVGLLKYTHHLVRIVFRYGRGRKEF